MRVWISISCIVKEITTSGQVTWLGTPKNPSLEQKTWNHDNATVSSNRFLAF